MPIHNLCIGTYIPNTTHLIFSLQDLIYYIIFPIACLYTTYINCYIASNILKNVYLQFYLPNIDTLHNLIYLPLYNVYFTTAPPSHHESIPWLSSLLVVESSVYPNYSGENPHNWEPPNIPSG